MKPSLSFWTVGVLGLLALDVVKSALVGRKRRESWQVRKQALFYGAFYAIAVAWALAGSGLVHGTNIVGFSGDHGADVA